MKWIYVSNTNVVVIYYNFCNLVLI
jgi:hypothetical protein